MAALDNTMPTILDQLKRTDPDGSMAQIVEAQAQRNPLIQDAVALEGNLTTGHRVTIRSGLPTVGFRRINQGVAKSKSHTEQVDESCGLLEGRSEVDCELARLGGNEAAFRASEDSAFMQSMMIEATKSVLFASTKADPEKIHGLTPRFDSLASDPNSDNVIDPGFSLAGGDNASIWFVTWSPEIMFMIYPKGTKAGLEHIDMGKEYVEDANGDKFLAWRSHFIWRLGLCVKDWRYIVRICNIDKSAVTAAGPSDTKLLQAMVEAYNRVYAHGAGREVIYMNRFVANALDQQTLARANVNFTPMEWHGRKVQSFRGIPIVTLDALAPDEATVS